MKIVGFSVACLAAVLLLPSCGTNRRTLRLPPEPVVTVEQEGVTMTLRFLDESSLRQKFGSSENPFLTDYNLLMFRRNVVFELTIQNQGPSSFLFELRGCELQYGGKTLGPLNRFQLASDVHIRDEDPRLKAPKTALIERYVLPNKVNLAPGGLLTGYLLFQGNLPVSGEAQVSIAGAGSDAFFRFRYVF
jgi:hypothetical protein